MNEPDSAREAALQNFLKIFRIALNFISLYSKEHKSFIASVGDVKSQIDRLLAESSPMTIVFSPDALSIDGISFSKKQLYLDLSKQFHFRKVKSLQISSGVSLQELCSVLELACLPVKEVLSRGGMQHILSAAGVVNAKVEELDYSSFLRDEGDVEADAGALLLNQSMQGEDPVKVREFARHFESAIAHVSIKSIVEEKQLGDNLRNFLAYVHTSDYEAFHKCTKSLFRVVLKDKAPATLEQMAAFAGFVKGLSADAIASVIVEEASQNDGFNNENLAMFLKALDSQDSGAVSSSLAQTLTAQDPAVHMSPKASSKLKDLFTVSEAPLVSGIYQRVMETLARNIEDGAPVTFDRERAFQNYRFILLYVLGFEQEPERIETVAQRICSDWQNIIQDPVPDYFHALEGALSGHLGQMAEISSLNQLDLLFRGFVEEAAFKKEVPGWMDSLIDNLRDSTRDDRWYLEKMLAADTITRRSLSLFMRLFPEHTGRLCERLSQSAGDIEFMGSIVEELKHVKSPQAVIVLENIYGFSNDLIKIEALKAMMELPDIDEKFLIPIMSQENVLLRKEAMAVLASSSGARDKALDLLLRDNDVWGRKNVFVQENIGIVEELHIREAVPYLERIGRKPFFWNAALRRCAQKARGGLL